MKRPFPLLVAIVMVTVTAAQKPLSKKSLLHHSLERTILKSSMDDYQPTHCTTDYWNGIEWVEPIVTNLQYNENGLLWISESTNDRTTYTYYENNKIKDKIRESYDGIAWQNDYKYSYIYDECDDLSQVLIYYWYALGWELSEGTWNERIYDSFGEVVGVISYYYDYPDGWIEIYGYKTDYTYEDGLLTEQISYDRYEGSWFASWKNTWTYDENNFINGGYEYYSNGSNFELVGRYVDVKWYFWNSDGHVQSSYVDSYTYQEYTGPAFPHEEPDNETYFVDVERLSAAYPDGNGCGTPPTTIETYQIYNERWLNDFRWTWLQMSDYTSELDEIWNQSSWLKYYYTIDYKTDNLVYTMNETYRNGVLSKASKESELFDDYGNQTEIKSETKNGDEDWLQNSGEKWIYIYEGFSSKVLTKVNQNWDVESALYVNTEREQFYYEATLVEQTENKFIKIYPTIIQNGFTIVTSSTGILVVYNAAGTKVLERTIDAGESIIHIPQARAGLYFVKVKADNIECTEKLIKY